MSKLVIFVDHRTPGAVFTLEIGPDSPWHELLPEVQVGSVGPSGERDPARPNPVVIRS